MLHATYIYVTHICDVCAAGYSGGSIGFASLISLIDARDASNTGIDPSSSAIPDLSGTPGMTWTQSWGSTSFETVNDIPCWNLNAGGLVTSTRTTLGDSYTLFYYWKPRESDTAGNGWRTLHRGTSDHWAIVGKNNKNLGIWSSRNGGEPYMQLLVSLLSVKQTV